MENIKHFKPKAHILRLLGEELIKSPIMAIYELVKNSYDADSSFVNVSFSNIQNIDEAKVIIEDNGTGLTSEVIENVWLEPGTDHRKPIDDNGNRVINRSPVFNRVPMGEKGVGRFAVHKLGNVIKLTTRPAKIIVNESGVINKEVLDYEITLTIDWIAFSQSKYLEDIPITWQTNKDESKFHFKENSGTLIEVTSLKEPWTRRMARSLKRNVVSMVSPKSDLNSFKINLEFGNNWLEGFPDATEVLKIAPYHYTAILDENYNLEVDYEFKLNLNPEIGENIINDSKENVRGLLRPKIRERMLQDLVDTDEINEVLNKLEESKNPFGNIMVEIHSYDMDPDSFKDYTYDSKTVKSVLKENSGIKVFKDDMRVFNYGEPGNDWLNIDIERVQNKKWFSNNQVIGTVYLDSINSTKLIEKTNREGFVEDNNFSIFYDCIRLIIEDFKVRRQKDREKWLALNHKITHKKSYKDQTSLFNDLIDSTDFSDKEKKEKLKIEAENLQKDFEEKKNILLIPAGVGMTASVALHEIEKLVPRMKEVINATPFLPALGNEKVNELNDYVQGILSVLRKGGSKPINIKESIEKAISNYSYKLKSRKIEVLTNFDDTIEIIKCDKRYFMTMVMNIIDNSIYWLDTIYKHDKGIYIKTYLENDFPVITIVDNGPGLKDEITDLVRPFFSRKDDGIGIGLYLIDTIMMKYGKFEMLEESELENIEIPEKYRGAALKITFNKNQ
ncbi:sensor histidine kinase [Wenyingzhuangia sp. chi5]|uniref:Sensor histidine kinase n=1 Tax=Wenyingzhuangia gilva TaxID=3057677 RepID=A0ABT8VV82_9FLAO|nr:sensor histidine kinase [Wenyingzhuangia sp. chi5]MDO3695887.1 sensor histidine kinase [Wenyingzhuangia sp. chi5]